MKLVSLLNCTYHQRCRFYIMDTIIDLVTVRRAEWRCLFRSWNYSQPNVHMYAQLAPLYYTCWSKLLVLFGVFLYMFCFTIIYTYPLSIFLNQPVAKRVRTPKSLICHANLLHLGKGVGGIRCDPVPLTIAVLVDISWHSDNVFWVQQSV